MSDDRKDFYETLQVQPTAEQEVIEAAYRRLLGCGLINKVYGILQ